MLKRSVVIFAAAAFLGGAMPTQTAQAEDDIWDLMDPSWWYDEMFDNDNDDWWRYRHHRYNPYWGSPYMGSPYGGSPQVIVILQEPERQNTRIKPPE